MRGNHNGPPRQVNVWVLPLVLLIAPASAVAQEESAVSTDQPPANSQAGGGKAANDILNLDIEQLARTPVAVPSMDIPVTSVTKEASTVGRSPAAVFVITNEMIRRSGVTTIPEALRMAPGLEVAHINAHTWAITSRGFNDVYANKLLVLIDGRTVYSPVDSGVFWDAQDVLLEDIERIEVVRGPGGTLWGANAVNGVINIITKKVKDTQGAYVMAGGGTQERMDDGFRYGGQIGEGFYYRIYGKHFERGPGFDPNMPANDAWRAGRFGFRADWDLDRSKTDSVTIQGDHYVTEVGQSTPHTLTVPPFSVVEQGKAHNTGQNVLMRWRHVCDEDSDWALQMYYDEFLQATPLSTEAKTFDVDFQYRFPLGDRQQFTCGAGYRYIHYRNRSDDPFTLQTIPPEGSPYVVSQFLQDEIALAPDVLGLTLGCKLEENTYTYFEYQPTARLLWTPDRQHSVWGAVSRAVRTPNPIERGLSNTAPPVTDLLFPRLLGNPASQSETLMAYEMGYRTQATERFAWDIATFYNVYDRLSTVQALPPPQREDNPPPPHFILPLMFTNGSTADVYGVELATNWSLSERWRLYTQYTLLRMFVHGLTSDTIAGQNPHHQVYLRSTWDLREDLDFDLMARYVDALTSLDVPSYVTMDLRLAYRPRKHLELAVVAQNLLQTYHYEFGQSDQIRATAWEVTEVPRGVYGTLTWRR